jgi:hypothetical protein
MAECALHLDRAAVGECASCYRPYCAECAVEELSTEVTYCSVECRDRATGAAASRNELLAAAAEAPIRSGWRLWFWNLPSTTAHAAPIAAAVALGVVASGSSLRSLLDEEAAQIVPPAVAVICGGLFAYGFALTSVLLSAAHVGHDLGNVYVWTAKRFVPWVGTWALVFAATLTGLFLLIIPGIIAALRLFWADEFALVHSANPVAACRESWRVTEGHSGAIFVFQFVLGLAEYLVLIPALVLFVGIQIFVGTLDPSRLVAFFELFVVILLAYGSHGSVHAPELVYFYGLRAKRQNRTSSA